MYYDSRAPKVNGKIRRHRSHRIERIMAFGPVLLVATLYVLWPVFKRLLRPRFVFVVYGNRKQQSKFFPEWFTRIARGCYPITFLKFRGKWGFICATPFTEEELNEDPSRAAKYLDAIRREFPRMTGNFALAGRLPSWYHKATGEAVPEPFRDGALGTRYAMLRTAEALAKKAGKPMAELVYCVPGGAGYAGKQVVVGLASRCKAVIALDPRFVEDRWDGNILYTSRQEAVSQADAVIVLTGNGRDVRTMIPYLSEGTVIADDTHPPIPPEDRFRIREREALLWKTVAETEPGVTMWPHLPGFQASNVPGCLLQCIVEMHGVTFKTTEFSAFCEMAERLGFDAKLIEHPTR